jgi:hypothetical protein
MIRGSWVLRILLTQRIVNSHAGWRSTYGDSEVCGLCELWYLRNCRHFADFADFADFAESAESAAYAGVLVINPVLRGWQSL